MAIQLLEQVQSFLTKLAQERPSHLPPHTRLIIGVSGGPDSLALLHLLQTIYSPQHLIVAHLNHQLRPSAADETQFVAATAAAWHIPCHSKKIDVPQLAAEQKLSIEAAGRLARYQYFAQLAAEVNAGSVAVAHHADDQAETVLMHILRGSGLAGLRGILPITNLAGAPSLLLIRPLLHVTRADIAAYCQQHNLHPLHDESNTDLTFLRNRVRHQLLPVLATYNPQIKARLQQLAAVVAADYELLDTVLAENWAAVLHTHSSHHIQLDRATWLSLPLSLRRSTLRYAVQQLRPFLHDIGFQPIEQARQIIEQGHTGAQASLPGDLTIIVGYQHLTLTAGSQPIPTDLPQLPDDVPVTMPVPGQIQLANNWTITASRPENRELPHIQTNEDQWIAYVNVGNVEHLGLRARQPGEQIRPLGMKGHTVKIKDLMINRKIPVHLRRRWPLVVYQDQVIWVVGHHLDERVRVTADTRHLIKLQCQPS
jgi:tRNA(Ile)-lysidine synthase